MAAYSLHDATITMAQGAMQSLKRILTTAAQHQPDSAAFFTSRLADDMNPLTFQIHYATYSAQCVAALLSGHEIPDKLAEEDITSYDSAQQRVQQTLEVLGSCNRDQANALAEQMMTVKRPDGDLNVPISATVTRLHMPNVYFHVSMAYAIMRKEGVPLGKRDWSRGFVSEYI